VKRKLKKPKPAKTIFANRLTGIGVEYVNQHILFRMPGEEAREDFNELLFIGRICLHETIPNIEAMRPFAAIQSDPVSRSVGSGFIQPLSVFEDAGFNFFEVDTLGNSEAWKKQCGC